MDQKNIAHKSSYVDFREDDDEKSTGQVISIEKLGQRKMTDWEKTQRERQMGEIKEALKGAKKVFRELGPSGPIVCPSCQRTHDLTNTLRETKSGLIICLDCFLLWASLYLDGHVKRFSDVIPKACC